MNASAPPSTSRVASTAPIRPPATAAFPAKPTENAAAASCRTRPANGFAEILDTQASVRSTDSPVLDRILSIESIALGRDALSNQPLRDGWHQRQDYDRQAIANLEEDRTCASLLFEAVAHPGSIVQTAATGTGR